MGKRKEKAEYETMLQCFDSVIFYNGYSDFFRDVYKLFKKYMEEGGAEIIIMGHANQEVSVYGKILDNKKDNNGKTTK